MPERLCNIADLPPGEMRAVSTADGTRICLVNVDGEIHAVSDVCTHQEFAMSDGMLLPGGIIECAWHGAQFDCRTGAVKRVPATEPLPVYEVTVQDGGVYVGERKQ